MRAWWLMAAAGCGWGAGQEAPPPPAAPVVEPAVAGPTDTLRCLRDGEAVAATWKVDEETREGVELVGPHRPGVVVRCAADGATSAARVIHGGGAAQNVLFILLDDVGFLDVSTYGGKGGARTPRIDALADQGVRFDHAWSEPMCSPTRASLLTGLHPANHGIGDANHEGHNDLELDDRLMTLPDALRERGVADAGAFGKWHLMAADSLPDHPGRVGFTTYALTPGNVMAGADGYRKYDLIRDGELSRGDKYLPQATIEAAARFIEGADGPWMAWVAFHLAHVPFHVPPDELAPAPERDGATAKYLAMVRAADTLVGRLVDRIPPDVLARTVVVVMGDNGTPREAVRAPLREDRSKFSVYEGGLRVPLVISAPSVVGPGRTVHAPVSAVDLLPTLLELVGAPLTEAEAARVDGRSFAELLWTERPPDGPRSVYAETFRPNSHDPGERRLTFRAVSDGRYKLLVLPTGREVYDLREDPWERDNLLGRKAVPEEAKARLQALIDAYSVQRPWPPG